MIEPEIPVPEGADWSSDHLRPCVIEMAGERLDVLARDHDAASLFLDLRCIELEIERVPAEYFWDAQAVAKGWVEP